MLKMFQNYLVRKNPNNIVWMRGIYLQKPNQYQQWTYAYDELRDVSTSTTMTLKLNRNDRSKLKSNSLVNVGGMIELTVNNHGYIQVLLDVTRVEIVKDQFVTEEDLKREEIRLRKNKAGFKNVDAILENILFKGDRPKILLVFAGSSITASDFRAGLEAAATNIDFTEEQQSFGNSATLSAYIKDVDGRGFDAFAMIRGGGAGIEALDAIDVLEQIANTTTPVISAIGHVDERLFFKSLADKEVAVPHALGTYFKDMVERVAEKRNSSRAVLVKEVQKQFQKQIDDSNKKNKQLLEQIDKLQKQSKEQSKAFNENLAKVQKQNKETVEKLQKQNADMQKQNKENIDKIQKQNQETVAKLQKQNDDNLKQNKENVEKIQKQNKETVEKLQKQNEEIRKQNKENIEKLQKQNQETVAKLQKQNDDNLKQNKENVEKMQKQNQETVDKLQKQNEDIRKQNKENIEKLQKQNKESLDKLNEENKKNIDSINKAHKESLDKIQKANSDLQKSLEKLNAQNTESAKALSEATTKAAMLQKQLDDALKQTSKGVNASTVAVIAIVAAVIAFIIGFCF